MGTVVRATCPDCGDVRLTTEDVTLRFLAETTFEKAQYRFICPNCVKIVLKPADHAIATLLYSSGVRVEKFELPLELMERPNEFEKPVITDDDILDLCLELQRDEEGWLRRMINRGRGQ